MKLQIPCHIEDGPHMLRSRWTHAAQILGLSLTLALGACGSGGDEEDDDPPGPAPTVSIAAAPATVAPGGASSLSWSSTNANACVASGAWTGGRSAAGSMNVMPTALGPATYTLTCSGSGGEASASATVTVEAAPAVPSVTITADPVTVVLGAATALTWSSINTTGCVASDGWSGSRTTSGNENVTPAAAGAVTYTLTCTGPGGSDSAAVTVTANAPPPVVTGAIRGRVINTVDGTAVTAAMVRAAGLSAMTGADGAFALAGVPVGARVAVQVDATGFETSHRIASVFENEEAMVSVLAVPVGATGMVMPALGGDVQIAGSTAMVSFPAGAIDATDPVQVSITDLNPASSPGNMPGDYTTMADGQIESFGALTVNVRTPSGASVPMRPGATATLRIPLSSLNTAPMPTIPLYFYDEAAGRWVEQGMATLVGSGTDRYYEGAVPHFTTWNADILYQSVLLTGCVQDRGVPVAGVSITSTGKNYTGMSSARTGADGRFTIRVRPNSLQTLSGMLGGLVTSTREVSSSSADQDITSSCLQIVRDGTPFSIKLSWGATPSDLDSRIYLPQGGQVSYQNRGSLMAEPFVNLDTDDTSSFGPEVITVLRPRVGVYRYFVNNFSRLASGITPSPTRIELMANGALQIFTPPAGESAATFNWTVFDIAIDANCQATLTLPTAPWTAAFPSLPQPENPGAAFCSN